MPLGSQVYRQRMGLPDLRPNQRVKGQGPVPAQVMLIGERPGEKEAKAGRPFIGLAGQYLDQFLGDAGLDRDQIYITNLVKEFAEYDKPTEFEIKRDWPELLDEIGAVRPKVIGLLGTFAVENLLERDRAQLERTHGVPIRTPFPAGFLDDVIWLPMYHPASGFYNQQHMALCADDFRVLGAIARDENTAIIRDQFLDQEDYRECDGKGQAVKTDAAIDTEGNRVHPWCLTYSVEPGHSWLQFPGRTAASFEGHVWLHNSLHDLSVLRSLGITIREGHFTDTMVLAYLLCLEPQGLKDLAYRHAGMVMDSYDDIIGAASRDKAIEYLTGVDACEWTEAKEYVIIEGGKAKIKKPHGINQRVRRILADVDSDKRKKDGSPVDPRERWDNIDDYLKQEVVAELGPMPEASLDDVPRAKACRYACRDSDATLRIAPVLEAKISQMGLSGVSRIDHDIIPMIDRMQTVGMGLAEEKFWDELEAECDAQMGRSTVNIYRATGASINPDSPDQVADLLFKQLKLPVIKLTEGGDPSTKDKALEAIYHLHPVVDMVLDYREASKIKSSYSNPLRALVRKGQTRVHPNLRITRVSSGRLAANKPNLLAIPVRSALGKRVREGFVAGEGRLLLDLDLDQVEMRWMADQSRDAALVRLFLEGKLDVHTATAARMFSVAYADVKVEQRYAAKRVGFGVITGITEYGLVDQMILARAKRPDGENWSLDDCQQMIQGYFGVYPGVKMFMERAGDEAENTGMARDHWGRIRYLPGARSPIPAVRAEARRQASSHKIQAGAQGYMKLAMAAVWQDLIKAATTTGWDSQWPIEPLLQIHDSLLFDIDEEYGWIEPMIVAAMTKTTPSLTGLPFKAKGGKGKTWAGIK